jgi:hypothetical protein
MSRKHLGIEPRKEKIASPGLSKTIRLRMSLLESKEHPKDTSWIKNANLHSNKIMFSSKSPTPPEFISLTPSLRRNIFLPTLIGDRPGSQLTISQPTHTRSLLFTAIPQRTPVTCHSLS